MVGLTRESLWAELSANKHGVPGLGPYELEVRWFDEFALVGLEFIDISGDRLDIN